MAILAVLNKQANWAVFKTEFKVGKIPFPLRYE